MTTIQKNNGKLDSDMHNDMLRAVGLHADGLGYIRKEAQDYVLI